MWLQAERVPSVADGRVTEPDGFRHLSRTPMRRATRRGFQRPDDHLLHLRVGDRPLRPGARFIVESVEPVRDEATAPLAHGARCDTQATGDDLAGGAVGARQNDARTPRDLRRRSRPMRQRLRSEEHTSELQSQSNLVCRLLLEKKKNRHAMITPSY